MATGRHAWAAIFETNMDVPSVKSNDSSNDECKFYEDAQEYWSAIEPTVDGMLGGFGCLSSVDIRGFELFLMKIFNTRNGLGRKRALDCGAGIGRITKNLLVKHFDKVDLVEQNSKFIDAAKKFLSCESRVGNYYVCGLQDFEPKTNFYDVIWCQWVLGHLTDKHLVDFLMHCKKSLKKNGVIVIKENISSGELITDVQDSSVTRSNSVFLKLFSEACLGVIKQSKQANFPRQLMSVKIFALEPLSGKGTT